MESAVNPHAQIGAARVRHFWEKADPAAGHQEIEKDHIEVVMEKGVLSETKNLTTIQINTVVEKIQFDVNEVAVKAGKQIKLIFNNPDFMPHNLLVVKPGTADAVAQAAIQMGAEGFKKQFVPEDDSILVASKLLQKGEKEGLEFSAPSEPGDYQFVCTFPGHALLMRGVIKVQK